MIFVHRNYALKPTLMTFIDEVIHTGNTIVETTYVDTLTYTTFTLENSSVVIIIRKVGSRVLSAKLGIKEMPHVYWWLRYHCDDLFFDPTRPLDIPDIFFTALAGDID